MPSRLRIKVDRADDEGLVRGTVGNDNTWSWLAHRPKQGSFASLSALDCSEKSFGDSLGSTTTQEEVCLSPLSQYFCNVEQPPDIYAIMTLDGFCALEELVQPMQLMADLHDRFKRRLVLKFGTWNAEYLDEFDVRTLMREVTLEGADAQLAFNNYMGQLMSSNPLGMDGLPPWDVTCIHYGSSPARTDVLLRASHIIGDGQLFMKLIKQVMVPEDTTAQADYAATVLNGCSSRCETAAAAGPTPSHGAAAAADGMSMRHSRSSSTMCSDFDSGSDATGQDSERDSIICCDAAASQDHHHHHQQQQLWQQQQLTRRAGHPAVQQEQQQRKQHQRLGRRTAWQRTAGAFRMLWRVICMCWHAYTALVFTAAQPFLWSDPVTVIKASPQQCKGPRKWSSVTLRLPEFHQTAKALGSSINTLAVSCLSGGIRRCLIKHGDTPANRVRLCSMVDTRSMPGLLTGTDGNSNNFSFIGVPLVTGACSAVERVSRVGWSLSWIRHSLAVPLAIRMPSVINSLLRDPKWSTWAILRCLPSKATVGFSNMRGPAGRWSLAGHPVTRIYNGVQPNAFGCFVSLFSYGDTLTFTHTCYSSKTQHANVLLDCIVEEYNALRKAVAVSLRSECCSDNEPGTPGSEKIKAV